MKRSRLQFHNEAPSEVGKYLNVAQQNDTIDIKETGLNFLNESDNSKKAKRAGFGNFDSW